LRGWFSQLASTPRPTNTPSSEVSIPASLRSGPLAGAKASAVWSSRGTLKRITVTRDMFEFITIGPRGASAADLDLTRRPGEPPTFYAHAADGIYSWIRYK